MIWMSNQLGASRFRVQDSRFSSFTDGDAVYRFFELFDLPNVPNARALFELATAKRIRLTPPPKPLFEEKMLFALLWNRNLHGFWRQELGDSFFHRLLRLVPYTWIVDPAPLPPHGAIPELNLTDWRQLKALSQKERELILKVSGFSAHAWGARGVFLGSDLFGIYGFDELRIILFLIQDSKQLPLYLLFGIFFADLVAGGIEQWQSEYLEMFVEFMECLSDQLILLF